jgi:predicted oxidoreductase
MAVSEMAFIDERVAVEFLLARHRQRTRISNAIDTGQPARLETIIHAENVELERHAWRVIAAEKIGQVNHP